MTHFEFAQKLKKAIGQMPDTDGEPGYFAEVITLKDRSSDSYMKVIVIDPELPEEEFGIVIRKTKILGQSKEGEDGV